VFSSVVLKSLCFLLSVPPAFDFIRSIKALENEMDEEYFREAVKGGLREKVT
jgi:hypothetical protein